MKSEVEALAQRVLDGAMDPEAMGLRDQVARESFVLNEVAREERRAKTREGADRLIAKANARAAAVRRRAAARTADIKRRGAGG